MLDVSLIVSSAYGTRLLRELELANVRSEHVFIEDFRSSEPIISWETLR